MEPSNYFLLAGLVGTYTDREDLREDPTTEDNLCDPTDRLHKKVTTSPLPGSALALSRPTLSGAMDALESAELMTLGDVEASLSADIDGDEHPTRASSPDTSSSDPGNARGNATLVKRPWTPEEDVALVAAVHKYGACRWSMIATQLSTARPSTA